MRADDDGELIDLREVVVEHHAQIFRFARTLTRNDADAEDLAQTALVRALQRGPLTCSADQAKWYVLRIVRNLAIDQARARGRVVVEPRATLPDETASDELIDDVPVFPRAAFDALPAHHREVLHLRFFEELGYDKVAERLDTTEHAARQRVYRAMQALRTKVRFRTT
ncbi:MAG TPA: RNA polymerase sigma factor [Acidimicrobiia bacterium]|nr:RNA polymerase sigma factor [Acidimicrobiia bacterium]